jgi:hypothetical protein
VCFFVPSSQTQAIIRNLFRPLISPNLHVDFAVCGKTLPALKSQGSVLGHEFTHAETHPKNLERPTRGASRFQTRLAPSKLPKSRLCGTYLAWLVRYEWTQI